MTYRDRRLNRAARLRSWAARHDTQAAASWRAADAATAGIPPGQPILVGHHSEKRHRRALDRADARMHQAVEHADTAAAQRSRADNIEAAADVAIYADDADAIDRLDEKIAALEAVRDRIKVDRRQSSRCSQEGGEMKRARRILSHHGSDCPDGPHNARQHRCVILTRIDRPGQPSEAWVSGDCAETMPRRMKTYQGARSERLYRQRHTFDPTLPTHYGGGFWEFVQLDPPEVTR